MISSDQLSRLVSAAEQAGATHVFVARDKLDPDQYYSIRVFAGTDPRDVVDANQDWLVECYALQHPQLSIEDQLAEDPAWHLDHFPPTDPSTGRRRAKRVSGLVTEQVSLEQLQTAYAEVDRVRAEAASLPRASGTLEVRYRDACGKLSRLTRLAYEQGLISPARIRRTTGLHPDPRSAALATDHPLSDTSTARRWRKGRR